MSSTHSTSSASQRAHLLNALSSAHKGSANGIGADALARQLGISPRELRQQISDCREEGSAIVGTPSTGYYIAETAAELEQCCAWLRSRAMHSLRIESRLRNITLPELLGQLHLPT